MEFRVVMAVDDDLYIRLLPLAIAAYRRFFDCRISVVIVGNESPQYYHSGAAARADTVWTVRPVTGYHINPLSKIAENWIAGEWRNDTILINDVDRIPLSRNYIYNLIKDHEYGKITVAGKEFYDCDKYEKGKIPLAYVVTESKTYRKLWNSFNEDYYGIVKRWTGTHEFDSKEDPYGSAENFSDESLTRAIMKTINWDWSQLQPVKRTFGAVRDTIDRCDWKIDTDKLYAEGYVETHTMRPTNENLPKIQPIADFLGAKLCVW